MHVGRVIPPDEFWQRAAALDAQVRELVAVRPAFGLTEWSGSRMIAEWSLGDSTFRSVQYDAADASGQVVVSTSDDTDESALKHVLMNLPSDEPFEERMQRIRQFEVPPATAQTTVMVSGDPARFDIRVVREFTIADTAIGERQVVIHGRGITIQTLHLAEIDDIEPYLDGRRAMIKRARAEHGIVDPD
jgi:hypothetical protein